jgi:hypothetical protein
MAGAAEPVRAGLPPDEADDLRRRLRQHDQMYATMQQQGKPFDALEHLEKVHTCLSRGLRAAGLGTR